MFAYLVLRRRFTHRRGVPVAIVEAKNRREAVKKGYKGPWKYSIESPVKWTIADFADVIPFSKARVKEWRLVQDAHAFRIANPHADTHEFFISRLVGSIAKPKNGFTHRGDNQRF